MRMFCLKSAIALAFLVASAAAQGVFIASPIANSTLIPGETFVVDEFDVDDACAAVHADSPEWTTVARDVTDLAVVSVDRSRPLGSVTAHTGVVDVTNQVVADRLLATDCADGFLLDGYPRTLDQVAFLDSVLKEADGELDAVVSLAVDPDELVARLTRRSETDGRADDTPEAIRTRQQVYADQTAPLLEVYRDRGVLVEVDGLGDIDAVTQRLFEALDQRAGGRPVGTAS